MPGRPALRALAIAVTLGRAGRARHQTTPAKAGVYHALSRGPWIPASAGMARRSSQRRQLPTHVENTGRPGLRASGDCRYTRSRRARQRPVGRRLAAMLRASLPGSGTNATRNRFHEDDCRAKPVPAPADGDCGSLHRGRAYTSAYTYGNRRPHRYAHPCADADAASHAYCRACRPPRRPPLAPTPTRAPTPTVALYRNRDA